MKVDRLKLTNVISLFGIFVFSISIVLPENFRNIPLMLFSVVVAISIRNGSYDRNLLKLFLINSMLFFFQFLSLFYSQNTDDAQKRILVMISLFIIPLFFYYVSNLKLLDLEKTSKWLYKNFFLAVVLFFVGVFIQNYFYDHLNEFIFRDYSERLNSKYGKYSLHPIYASLFIGVSLILSTKIYKSIKKRIQKAALMGSIIFLTAILLLLARKAVILSLFIIFSGYFIISTKNKKILIYYLLGSIMFFIVSVIIPPIRDRYLELFNSLFSNGNHEGSTFMRYHIYNCVHNVIEQNPIFGYGIGDAKKELNNCYISNEFIFKGKYYNAHNQFLSVWISSGVAGFLALLGSIVYNFKLAIKEKSFIYLATLTLLTSTMLVENILERQSGVLLFSFFINFFAFKSLVKHTSN